MKDKVKLISLNKYFDVTDGSGALCGTLDLFKVNVLFITLLQILPHFEQFKAENRNWKERILVFAKVCKPNAKTIWIYSHFRGNNASLRTMGNSG